VPPELLTRRSFLAATGGLLVAAACGSSGSGSNGNGSNQARATGLRGLRVTTDTYRAESPQRFAFALTKDDEFYDGPAARIALVPPGATEGSPIEAQLHSDGLPEGRGIYVVDAVLPQAGIWEGLIEVGDERTRLPFQVMDASAAPVPGTAAPRAVSPTVADPLGVDPLCTRDPDCPLHDRSLDQLVGAGKPVAAMFATPARCSSQYCGPTLDLLLDVMEPYQDRVEFVHVEIYRAETGLDLVPTVESWGLATEPWLFGIDASGTVTQRLDGAFDRAEVRTLLDRLVA
jgi:hypothetical protein